jgi:hypothetical protein
LERIVEESIYIPDSKILYQSLELNPDLYNTLLTRLSDQNTPHYQFISIVSALHSFVVKSFVRPVKPISSDAFLGEGCCEVILGVSALANLAIGACIQLAKNIENLCMILVNWNKELNEENSRHE